MFPSPMKFPLFVAPLLLLMVWVPQALTGKITLAWNATTTHTDGSAATDLAGYHLYSWQGTGTPTFVNLGKRTTSYTSPDTFTDLVEGETYPFAVVAYDTAACTARRSTRGVLSVPPSANIHQHVPGSGSKEPWGANGCCRTSQVACASLASLVLLGLKA